MLPLADGARTDDDTVRQRARAAYLTIRLDLADELRSKNSDEFSKVLTALEEYQKLLDVLFLISRYDLSGISCAPPPSPRGL